MRKIIEFLTGSNRLKHLGGGLVLGLFFTFFCALGAAFSLEYKDKAYGGTWDWIDLGFTIIGGGMGQLIQIAIFDWLGFVIVI